MSLLRGPDGQPKHFVTMVEDISELHLLQERFQYQALHDAMTGLANRQFFRTRLEAALGSLPQDAVLTLYHLGLDGFELINDGLGYEVGDSIIRAVARRLEQLVEREEALVARFGGTEFALLELLMAHPKQVLTRSRLLEDVWGYDFPTSGNALEVYIGYLRRKTEAEGEPRLIHTVRGVGYVLRETPP